MTKGVSYRAYYVANRQRILDTNNARAREKRQEENEDERQQRRERDRKAYNERKAKQIKDAFLARANDVEGDWKFVYQKLATLENLQRISNRQLDFLLTLQ